LAQAVQQCLVQPTPDALDLPLPQAPPAGHATAEAQLLRQVFPSDAGHQDEEDAVERGAVVAPRPTSLGRRLGYRHQRLEVLPELLADQGSFHLLMDIIALHKVPGFVSRSKEIGVRENIRSS